MINSATAVFQFQSFHYIACIQSANLPTEKFAHIYAINSGVEGKMYVGFTGKINKYCFQVFIILLQLKDCYLRTYFCDVCYVKTVKNLIAMTHDKYFSTQPARPLVTYLNEYNVRLLVFFVLSK